jgi:hypothetical protein
MVEEVVTFLERRFSTRPSQPLSTLFDRMTDEIDGTEQTSPAEWETVKQSKKNIFHRCIMTGRGMEGNYHQDVLLEQEKYFIKHGADESTTEWQLEVFKAIESRRLHMLERGTCVT